MKRKVCECDSAFYSKVRLLNSDVRVFSHTVDSLVNLSAKVVAEYIPFEYVERKLINVPDIVQERIIYHSFPRRDGDIYTYASFHSKSERSRGKLPYYQGQELFHNHCVEGVVQIGFHLTGSVKNLNNNNVSNNDCGKSEVSITFDRCKIISACCDCGSKGLSWCPHIVALALYRIRKPQLVQYRSPISDALLRMNRGQLQKFAQYLIASHPNKVLPSAQQLADQLLLPESIINTTCGAPDPTAGGGIEEIPAWYLDESGVREQLRAEFSSLANSNGIPLNANNAFLSFQGQTTSSPSSRYIIPTPRTGQTASATACSHPGISSVGTRAASSEIGLDWLIRYRRVCQNYNPLSVHPAILTQHQHPLTCPTTYSPSCLCQSTSICLGSNSNQSLAIDRQQNAESFICHFGAHDRGLCNGGGTRALPFAISTCCNISGCNSGGRITAMLAKVRELLIKKDSNGPRLLSIITEELLHWPHPSVMKSRRAHRSTSFDPSRASANTSNRLHSLNPAMDSLRHGSAFNSETFHQLINRWPSWTTRLWEEICLLWTCVVLSPDCNTETRRRWREQFLTWSRLLRCPRDEGFFVPSSYFAFFPNYSEVAHLLNDDVFSTVRSTHQQSSSPRVSIFYLPIMVSFMTWSAVWLQRLASTVFKESKGPNGPVSGFSPSGGDRVHPNMYSDLPFEPFNVMPSVPSCLSPPDRPLDRRNCNCPYCDCTVLFTEPFPLLCLRVTALRTNGYGDEAIRLAVLITKQFLQFFHTKVASFMSSYNPTVHMGNNSHCGLTPRTLVPNKPNSVGHRTCNSVPLFQMNITTSEPSTGHRSVVSLGARHLNGNNHSSYSPYQFSNLHSYNHPPVHSPPISGGTFHPVGRLTSPRSPLSPPISMGPVHRLPPPPPPPLHYSLHTGTPPPPLYRSVFPGQHRSTSHAYHPTSSCAQVLPSGHHQHIPTHASPILPHSSGGNISVGAGPPLPSLGHTCYQRQHHYVSPPLSVFTARAQTNRHVTDSHQPLVSTASAGGQRLPPSLHFLPPPHHNQRYHHPVLAYCRDPAQTCSAKHDEFGCLLPAGLMTSSSQQFPQHSSDCGWVGMPGRPLVGLVECLMEAAVAVVVERHTDGHCCCLDDRRHQRMEGAEQQAAASGYSSLSSASRPPSFYICLAIRISLLSMFQQRQVSTSLTRLSSGLCQEARILSLLSTVPKDETALRAICETVCQLLGPPPSQTVSSERSGRLGVATGGGVRSYSVDPLRSAAALSSSAVPAEQVASPHWLWWWSQLGPLVHVDSHPVHATANFILNYLQQEAQHYPLSQTGVPCDSSIAGWASLGIDHLLMAMLTRTIRFSTLDQLSDGAGSPSSTNYRHAVGGGNLHSSDASTGNSSSQLQRGWQSSMENAFPHNPVDSSHSLTGAVETSAPSLSRWDYPFRLCSDVSTSGRSPPLPSTMVASILSCLSPPEAFADYYRGYAQSRKEADSQCLCSSASSTPTMEQVSRSVGRSPLADSSGHQQHHRSPRHPFEMLESRQTQLAVALIRYTSFHIHRLDHVVQLCSRYIRSASSLGTISQQVFSDLIVGANMDSWCGENHLLTPSGSACRHHFSPVKQTPAGHCLLGRHYPVSEFPLHLLCTAFYLAILAVMRANTSVSHRRRRELLVWMLTLALHVGPPACLHLLTHWQRYATPWEAVYLIAPTLLMVVPASPTPGTADQQSRTQLCRLTRSVSFGPVTVANLNGVHHPQQTPVSGPAQPAAGEVRPQYPLPGTAAIQPTNNPTMLMADEILVRQVLPIYSAAASEQISAFVKHMAMQAASRDPVNCAIPALALAGGNTSNFDVVYRTIVASAEAGALGSSQLFTLARYMESRGWPQRALPFTIHAVRLLTLTSTQDNYSGAGDVLWACSLAQRLGPWALQQVLAHVVRNIHCPILLTDILYRCRVPPPPGSAGGNHGGTAWAGENQPPTNSNCGYLSQVHGKQTLLSLDRMPLKGLLDAAIWAYFTETHARLANISPRQYSEFIEFLTRARDTFGLLRPHGPNQFHAMIEGLRQIYRGKRKLVALLSERFG